MKPEFRELCRRALQDNDDGAYNATFGAQHHVVYRCACRFTGCRDAAEDVLQETVCVIFQRGCYAFDSEIPLRAWMCRVALNLSRRHRHGAARRTAEPLDAGAPISDGRAEPLADLIAVENGDRVRQSLDTLGDEDRALLALRAEKLSYTAIARVLGIPVTAVGPRLHRALNRLHAALQFVDRALAAEYPRGGGRDPKSAPTAPHQPRTSNQETRG